MTSNGNSVNGFEISVTGGKVTMPKTKINDDFGDIYMALFVDTEGNTIPIHSRN
jgi:predicted enzyme related to lactoylglutathione lyase